MRVMALGLAMPSLSNQQQQQQQQQQQSPYWFLHRKMLNPIKVEVHVVVVVQ